MFWDRFMRCIKIFELFIVFLVCFFAFCFISRGFVIYCFKISPALGFFVISLETCIAAPLTGIYRVIRYGE